MKKNFLLAFMLLFSTLAVAQNDDAANAQHLILGQ